MRIGKFTINIFNSQKLLFLLILTLLVFPKGGIKISNVPITWGYLLLGLVCLASFFQRGWTIHRPRMKAFVYLIPFQVLSSFSMLFNGVETVGWTISFLISFFFLPFVFLLILSQHIESMNLDYFFSLLRKGVLFVSCYGLFLFVYKQVSGEFLEIPFITVNWGDLGNWNTKCNDRGIVSKLVSTYNNGQLFGVSLLMLLPLYCYLEKSRKKRAIVKLALVLTLSRTVWIGLFIHEILYSIAVLRDRKKSILNFLVIPFFSLFVLFSVSTYYGFGKSFFLDVSLGGRTVQVKETIDSFSFFPAKKFLCLLEMTYFSILNFFGSLGLLTYLIGMIGPLFFYLQLPFSPLRACVLVGLINYTVVAFSDGATQYIPVLAFFWFLMSLLMRKNFNTCLRYS